MATRINLLLFDQVSWSSKHPLLRNSEKYSNDQNPSRLAYNEFGHGWSTVHLFALTVSRLKCLAEMANDSGFDYLRLL